MLVHVCQDDGEVFFYTGALGFEPLTMLDDSLNAHGFLAIVFAPDFLLLQRFTAFLLTRVFPVLSSTCGGG